jgi:hypothetical protein
MATHGHSDNTARTWRGFLAHEMFEYLFNFVFLAVFLVSFAWYRRLILAAYHIHYGAYWMPLVSAAVLAKVIMVGDALRVGQRVRNKPLVVVTVYRTIAFSLLVALFHCLEHIVEAKLQGKTVAEGVAAITEKGLDEILGSCVIIFAAFLPFFALKEIERVFGPEKVRRLFFHSSPPDAGPTGDR